MTLPVAIQWLRNRRKMQHLRTKQVQAQTYAQSPQLLELERLRLQKETAGEWAKHQGALVFGNGSYLQFQVPQK